MYKIVCCLMIVLIALTGCVSKKPTPQVSPLNSPLAVDSVPTPDADPPVPVSRNAVKFQIDRPVKAGATIVTGSGPAGVPISIVSVTTMGDELGIGVIGPDSRFSIAVAPLADNVRIGVGLGDLSGTDFTADEFNADVYKGSEALLVPLVGYFQDTARVQP